MATRVTSFDVARLAGVSQPTVSRALRNMPGTSPATRAKVLCAAKELNYVTSERGRALATRQTQRVALVVGELTNPFYPELVEPLRQSLATHGFQTVLVAGTASDGVDAADLADGSYDGVILTTTDRRSPLPRDLSEFDIPHVLVNRVLDAPESPSCAFDNRDGAAQTAGLLHGLGHRAIAMISGPVDTSTGHERAAGLRDALRRRGVTMRRQYVVRAQYGHEAGRDAARRLLELSSPPTAIVCGNDVLALGALSAARELGVVVPTDLSIVGFDDIPMASWPFVALTTVRCDLAAMAASSVQLLMRQIAGDPLSHTQLRLSTALVLRATHGPLSTSIGRITPR